MARLHIFGLKVDSGESELEVADEGVPFAAGAASGAALALDAHGPTVHEGALLLQQQRLPLQIRLHRLVLLGEPHHEVVDHLY
mmetsp:Transcript_41773/g.40126  ORF Transcript_41773/g.40126 Transcript_41773/m.40126 type:complete len:83 (-) Transcript_41773:1253-1501(-)